MTVDELKELIRNTSKNDIFNFTPTAISPILNLVENWQQDWTGLFKKLLERIKTGKGFKKDSHNKNGMYMSLPFPKNNQEFMVIFYTSYLAEPTRFLIYDFKIINNNEIRQKK